MLMRKQIYLEDTQIRKLKFEASKRDDLDVSKIIRIAIDRYIDQSENEVDWEDDPIAKMVGSCNANIKDASKNHDHYLYGSVKCK